MFINLWQPFFPTTGPIDTKIGMVITWDYKKFYLGTMPNFGAYASVIHWMLTLGRAFENSCCSGRAYSWTLTTSVTFRSPFLQHLVMLKRMHGSMHKPGHAVSMIDVGSKFCYWSLIFIDRHWYLLISIGVNATNSIRHNMHKLQNDKALKKGAPNGYTCP